MVFSNSDRSVNKSMRPAFVGMAAALVMGGGVAVDAEAQPLYRITLLDTAPSAPATDSAAYDINDLGQVVGRISGGDAYEAFFWSEQTGLQRIGDLPGGSAWSEAYGINNVGQVTGHGNASGGVQHTFIWQSQTGMQDAGVTSMHNRGEAINGSGKIVGYYGGTTKGGFLWNDASGGVDLGHLPSPRGVMDTYAYDINDAGQVVGLSSGRAFAWTADGGMIDIGTLANRSGATSAYGNNNLGQVVGVIENHAFVWSSDAGIQDLAMPSSDWTRSKAYEINDAGMSVGDAIVKTGAVFLPGLGNVDITRATGVLWTKEEGMFDLNTLIDPSDPLYGSFNIDHANAINANGQIVGSGILGGVGTRAYLLTPVPEAETWGMMLAGLGLVGFAAARRKRVAVK